MLDILVTSNSNTDYIDIPNSTYNFSKYSNFLMYVSQIESSPYSSFYISTNDAYDSFGETGADCSMFLLMYTQYSLANRTRADIIIQTYPSSNMPAFIARRWYVNLQGNRLYMYDYGNIQSGDVSGGCFRKGIKYRILCWNN